MSVTDEGTSAVSPDHPSPPTRRRLPPWATWLIVVVAVLTAVFYLGGGWYFSGMINDRALDVEERQAAMAPDFDYEVLAYDGESISLKGPADDESLDLPGVWGVRGPNGYGLARQVMATGPEETVRAYDHLTGVLPGAGDMVAFENRAFPDDLAVLLGTAPEAVTVAGPLGDYPGLLMEGAQPTWAILVHGYGLDPRENARLLPLLADEGYPAMLIRIRNDPGAPEDPSGMLRYGLAEWEDLAASVRYALDNGAEDVVLVGVSMGGGVVASFLYESDLRDHVRAVVLDAPMLDFGEVIDYGASQEELPLVGLNVPGSLTAVAKWFAGMRFDIDWDGLDYLARADELTTPILLFHGTADRRIPLALSERLQEARPDLVTLVRVDDAPHMGAWNVDPVSYESRLRSFLAEQAG